MFSRMIFMFNIRFYLHFIKLYDCKNKHIFPNFQIFSDNCAIYERFFVCYILAFCLSPAPEPRYFERASLNFHVRSSMKVRRAGLWLVSSR